MCINLGITWDYSNIVKIKTKQSERVRVNEIPERDLLLYCKFSFRIQIVHM